MGREEADFWDVKAQCTRLMFTHASPELLLHFRNGDKEQGSSCCLSAGTQLRCLMKGPCSLCSHTRESSSLHRCFAVLLRATSLHRGLSASSPGVCQGFIPTKFFSVSLGGLINSSQVETFPSLSHEAVAVAASRISRWVKFQRNDDGFDTSHMMTAEVLTPPLIPFLNRQGPWTWPASPTCTAFVSLSLHVWLALPSSQRVTPSSFPAGKIRKDRKSSVQKASLAKVNTGHKIRLHQNFKSGPS